MRKLQVVPRQPVKMEFDEWAALMPHADDEGMVEFTVTTKVPVHDWMLLVEKMLRERATLADVVADAIAGHDPINVRE